MSLKLKRTQNSYRYINRQAVGVIVLRATFLSLLLYGIIEFINLSIVSLNVQIYSSTKISRLELSEEYNRGFLASIGKIRGILWRIGAIVSSILLCLELPCLVQEYSRSASHTCSMWRADSVHVMELLSDCI